MDYTLGNKYAKNLCKRIVLLQLIIENVVTCFFGTQRRWVDAIRTASAKNRHFHVPQPTFLFPLETPLRLSRIMFHGWKDNLMLAKPLAACTYLSSIVSELYDA